MNFSQSIGQLESKNYILISSDQLEDLINASITVFEEDTSVSGFIRILKYGDYYLFQEQTPKGEIIIRKFDDQTNAAHLVEERLEIYEKMWNGCGCRIDYHK